MVKNSILDVSGWADNGGISVSAATENASEFLNAKPNPKPQFPQKKLPTVQQPRDLFHTPWYAVLLLKFMLYEYEFPWECAAGLGFISKALSLMGFNAFETDLVPRDDSVLALNFLDAWKGMFSNLDLIVTNPPFSLKFEFCYHALDLGIDFAILLPGEYSDKLDDLVFNRGCIKVVPNTRIDFITPNICQVVERGEVFRVHHKEMGKSKKSKVTEAEWKYWCDKYGKPYRYGSVWDIPDALINRHSASQFRSIWLVKSKVFKNFQGTEYPVQIPDGHKRTMVLPR